MLIIAIALLVALAGLLMYGFAANPKLQEVGRIMFFDGLLVTLLRFSEKTMHL